ncbi:MAG: AmmeMemoRadiSam system protein B [Chloroflexi bacterium]|nr:AmmeMemoRadiSam system protein B [Chloroflexota bacterium]
MNTKTVDPRSLRPSPIAGTWYPGSAEELAETVDALVARAEYLPTDDELIALISPHAGYPYSGQTAATAFRQLADRQYDLVVLLGPSHYADYGACAITSKKYYATPLGAVELDEPFIAKLTRRLDVTRVSRDKEHSLEIQLPFLQRMLSHFSLVPIMMSVPFYLVGEAALEPCRQLGAALVEAAEGRRMLLVASSDLSHLDDYAEVKARDTQTAVLLEAYDIPALVDYMWRDHECRACGDAPIITALIAAKSLGANRARVLRLTNSGEVTGIQVPGQYTVGYMAAAIYRQAGEGA